jgi:hypothetical protein
MGIGGLQAHIRIVSDRSPAPYGTASAYYRLTLRPFLSGKEKPRPMGIKGRGFSVRMIPASLAGAPKREATTRFEGNRRRV